MTAATTGTAISTARRATPPCTLDSRSRLDTVSCRALLHSSLGLVLASASFAQQPDQLLADVRLFTVMAAINAGGYDDGLNSEALSPVRSALREDLESLDPGMRSRLRTFYEQNRQPDPDLDLSQYISFALMCGEPPYFDLKAEVPTDLPLDVRAIRGMAGLLREFYELADIPGLWQKYQPAYDAAMLLYQESLIEAVFEINGYLRMPASSPETRGFQVHFDLLAAPGSINVRSYGGDVRVVIHSSAESRDEEIRAAYLLHQLDRLSIRFSETVARKEQLARFAMFAPALDNAYKTNFQLLVTKSLAHAIQIRMRYEPEEQKQGRVAHQLRLGFILTPYFYEQLAAYEAQPQSFRRYYDDLVEGIDVRREAARIQAVEFAERAPSRTPAPRRIVKPEVPEEDRLLAQAESLLQLNDLNRARSIYERVLTAGGRGRGQASYGLGRIALDEADPDLALEHFEAATEWTTDTRILAMSHIYMGRIHDILGNREFAVSHYERALASGETSPAIRRFSEEGLEHPFTGVDDDAESDP